MEFIDGSITELQTLKSLSQATRHTRLRPGMGYGLKMNVDLTAGTGTVGQEGTVVIDFKSQSISVEGLMKRLLKLYNIFPTGFRITTLPMKWGRFPWRRWGPV
jgi:hypothetical protein